MRNSVHGTPEQFEAALENRIAQLTNNSVNSSSIKSASSYETDEQYQERYIHSLIGDIDSKISKLVDSIQFEYNDNDIIITVGIDGTVKEYTVPYSDLKFDWDYIDDDVSYIIDEIRYDLDTYDEIDEEFNSAESIQAATFKDYNGIMGDPGATWTTEDLKAYWKANHSSDPVLNEYESMQSWLDDTIEMLHPVTDQHTANSYEKNDNP